MLPGAADRIIKMAESQSCHRQEMEKKIIDAEITDGRLGVYFAFFIALGCTIAATAIAIHSPENTPIATLFGFSGIASIVATFITSTRKTPSKTSDNKKEDK